MGPGVRILKRVIDIAGALAGISVTLPLYIPIAAAIRLDSPGPIFLVQRRSGRLIEDGGDGFRWVTFDMYKFRTMRPDAEAATGAVLSSKGDMRVTRVGRVLRATRLDELPQFWNVLRGDMSLVGPRPERPELLANMAMAIPFFEERTRGVKPGLTGLAQISLGYSGGADGNGEVERLRASLTNPFRDRRGGGSARRRPPPQADVRPRLRGVARELAVLRADGAPDPPEDARRHGDVAWRLRGPNVISSRARG